MDGRVIQRLVAVSDPQEAGSLLEDFETVEVEFKQLTLILGFALDI